MNLYNIHGLVKLRSNIKFPRISYFRDPTTELPDIIVNVGNVEDRGPNYACVDEIYSKYHYKLSWWRIHITNLEGTPINIRFSGDPFFSSKLLFSALVEPLIKYVLSRKGVNMIHASSLSLNGRGAAFCGASGTGKTTLLLNLLNHKKSVYYSDDQTIVKDGVLYSYPTPIGVRTNTLRNTPLNVRAYDLLGILTQNMLNFVTNYYGNLTWDIPIDRLKIADKNIMVGDQTPLTALYILHVGDKDQVTRLSKEEAISHLNQLNLEQNKKQVVIDRYFKDYLESTGRNLWDPTCSVLKTLIESSTFTTYLAKMTKPYKVHAIMEKIKEKMKNA